MMDTDRQRASIVRMMEVTNPVWVEHYQVRADVGGVLLVLTLSGSRRGFAYRDRVGTAVRTSGDVDVCAKGRSRILRAMQHDAELIEQRGAI